MGCEEFPDDWEITATVVKETGRKVLGMSSGQRKVDKGTWWWDDEVQESVHQNVQFDVFSLFVTQSHYLLF